MKKKTMSKKVAVLGIMICLALGLSACGDSNSENETTTTTDASEEADSEATAQEEIDSEATAQEEEPSVVLEELPSGDGVTDKQTVIDTYDQLYNSDDTFHLTYEMVKDMIGIDGELIEKESSAEQHYYLWYGEESNVILTVVFKENETDGYTISSFAIAGN